LFQENEVYLAGQCDTFKQISCQTQLPNDIKALTCFHGTTMIFVMFVSLVLFSFSLPLAELQPHLILAKLLAEKLLLNLVFQ
jgi:hypothetical protein